MNDLTIITPSMRPENLEKVKASIQFDKIKRWIIVHDTSHGPFTKIFSHKKIKEVGEAGGRWGFPQRNKGLNMTRVGPICFLDDDTLIHPDFWWHKFERGQWYGFNCQFNEKEILYGNKFVKGQIDMGQYVFDREMIGEKRFRTYVRNGDGRFIIELKKKYSKQFVYLNEVLATYNALR